MRTTYSSNNGSDSTSHQKINNTSVATAGAAATAPLPLIINVVMKIRSIVIAFGVANYFGTGPPKETTP